jgi:hypothetical protein
MGMRDKAPLMAGSHWFLAASICAWPTLQA